MAKLEWRIYYADKTTCDSSQVECWEDAPLTGVLFCVDPSFRTGRHVLSGCDYFYRPPSPVWLARQIAVNVEPFVAKTDNLAPALHAYAPWIKWGVWTGEKMFAEIAKAAVYDKDFPTRSATDKTIDADKVP